ncbi:MAG TPA: hypothetical protein VK714_23440 [Myxococcota bacterium]|nr:hypothetical protein [Myxococcota bacterium]
MVLSADMRAAIAHAYVQKLTGGSLELFDGPRPIGQSMEPSVLNQRVWGLTALESVYSVPAGVSVRSRSTRVLLDASPTWARVADADGKSLLWLTAGVGDDVDLRVLSDEDLKEDALGADEPLLVKGMLWAVGELVIVLRP